MKHILESPITGSSGLKKSRAAIQWRNGVLITDVPEKPGGKDMGPDPYTLLLSLLVSCTLATLRMYIEHEGLAISEIKVEANMSHSIGNKGTVMRIERSIEIQHLTDPELRERLISVAENCPVSKILKGNIKIITEFKSASIEFNED